MRDKSTINNAGSYSSFGSKLYRVHGGIDGQKTGLGMVLKVMQGDTLLIRAESFYNMPGGSPDHFVPIALTELLSAFTGSGALAGKGLLPSDVTGISGNPLGLDNLLGTTPATNTANAHLNWALFDE